MCTSYLDELELRAQTLEGNRDLLSRIYDAFSNGMPVDSSHYILKKILLDYDDVEEFVFSTKKRLKESMFTGAYAVVGEYGTGKTQYGLFLKRALEDKEIKVIYSAPRRPKDLERLQEQAFQLVDEGYNVVIILDNIDAYLSSHEEDPKGERKAISKLATLVESLSETPFITEGEPRGIALVFLLHTDSLNRLREVDERLRRISVIKELHKLSEVEEGGKLALSVLAVIYAHDEDCRRAVKKCGESLVKLLVKWGSSLINVKGSMGKGRFIKESFDSFKRILRRLDRCPAGATERGRLVEDFLAGLLEEEVFHIRVEKEPLSAKIVHRKSGPDLEIRLYRGSLPAGAPYLVIYGEVKSVKDTLRHCLKQLANYAEKRPLLLIVLAEDLDAVEEDLQGIEGRFPIAGLVYPLPLIEPIALIGSREEGASLLRGLLGRSLVSDVEWKIRTLITRPKPVNAREIAQKLINAARLRAERAKRVQLGRVTKKVGEVLGESGLKVGDPEGIAEEILEALTQRGFLNKKSSKTFMVEPSAWRDRWKEALDVVSRIVEDRLGH